MYNPDLKMKFVNDFTNGDDTRRAAVSLFKSLETYERKWGGDVCTQDAKLISEALNECSGSRTASKYTRYRIMQKYLDWCVEHDVPGAKAGVMNTDDIGTPNMSRHYISSPAHLQRFLDLTFKSESMKTQDDTYRCLAWLAYGGMFADDAVNVLTSDVDFDRMLVVHNDAAYPIYREAVHAFKNCATLDLFDRYHYSGSSVKHMARTPGNLLLRGVVESFAPNVFMHTFALRLRKSRDNDGNDVQRLELTYDKIWLSGVFYRVYELERMGVSADIYSFIPIVRMQAEAKVMKSEIKAMPDARNLHTKAGFMYRDYINWRQAFSIT